MSKKSIHRLTATSEESSVFLGISSHENDYRLSWAFNEYLGFRLVRADDLKFLNPKFNETQEFSVYTHTGDDGTVYRLISNRCDNGFLLDEFKNIDFVFVIQSQESSPGIADLLSKIRGIPFVSAVFPLHLSDSKGKKRPI